VDVLPVEPVESLELDESVEPELEESVLLEEPVEPVPVVSVELVEPVEEVVGVLLVLLLELPLEVGAAEVGEDVVVVLPLKLLRALPCD
jgi:hypothetical protein